MNKLFLAALATPLLAACQHEAETVTQDDVSLYMSAMEEADPETMRLERSCMLQTPDTTFTAALTDDVFDGRFVYAKRTGWENGYIVEFTDTCRNAQRGTSPRIEDTCQRDWLRIRGELCVVKDIYRVPNETVGRALALKLEQARQIAEADNKDTRPASFGR